jgi:hypothetical protein
MAQQDDQGEQEANQGRKRGGDTRNPDSRTLFGSGNGLNVLDSSGK